MLSENGPDTAHAACQAGSRAGAAPTATSFQVANALWAGAGVELEAAFVEGVAREFGGLASSVDFADERAARDRINGWVSAQTEGRIHDLIQPGALTGLTQLMLTNAVYFKDAWALPFVPARTRRRPFHCPGGNEVAVDMMQVTGPFHLARRDGVGVLTMPYRGGRTSMVVVLPDEADGLEAVEARLDAGFLDDWMHAGERVRVELSFPKFESGSSLSLIAALKELGMRQAFEPAAADLRGISPGPVVVGDIVHRSFVRVDEAGTEAAAATAVLTPRGASSASSATPFVVDHPFLYLIRDEESGRILFMGRAAEPRQGPGG